MDKSTRILLGILLLCLIHSFAFTQDKKQKPRIKFDRYRMSIADKQSITFRGDTIYAKFEYHNETPQSPLEVISVKPSCVCTGFKLNEPEKQGDKGSIVLVFTRASIEQFEIIETIVKSNAINDYELLEVVLE
jgi:hypothetical protein